MYTPRPFRENDLETLHSLIREFNFAILFSQTDETPWATHVPFLIDPDRGPHGTLISHMARANPHWKSWGETTRVLVVFQGPHAYISPAWYENQVTVPTWNYAAVHAYGKPTLIHEPDRIRPLVEALVENHEEQDSTWDRSLMEDVMELNLKALVGFEIPIERIEGTFKFNQNLPVEDQAGVERALRHAKDPMSRRVGSIIAANLNGRLRKNDEND